MSNPIVPYYRWKATHCLFSAYRTEQEPETDDLRESVASSLREGMINELRRRNKPPEKTPRDVLPFEEVEVPDKEKELEPTDDEIRAACAAVVAELESVRVVHLDPEKWYPIWAAHWPGRNGGTGRVYLRTFVPTGRYDEKRVFLHLPAGTLRDVLGELGLDGE